MHSCSTIETVEPPGPIYDVPKPDFNDLIKNFTQQFLKLMGNNWTPIY